MKIYCNVSSKYRKFENPKISLFILFYLFLSNIFQKFFTVSVVMNLKKYLKKKNKLKY